MKLTALILHAVSVTAQARFWMEDIEHLGTSPYHPDRTYQVFRNVKDFGAKGDGVTDDTAAINAAISFGDRCEPGVCKGNTVSPATVYFPAGIYLITSSIVDIYYTQMIGDPINRPTIKASSSFSREKFGLIDSNPYQSNGLLAWNSTNNFFRQIRNLVLDTTALDAKFPAIGIHWPASQATAITNCVFLLSTIPGNRHTGLFMEEGSGGLLNDLYFYGGAIAAVLGNQQYTTRNLWFFNADVAIQMPWDWGWTYKSVFFKDCRIGIQMKEVSRSVGSLTLIDSWFSEVDTAVSTTRDSIGSPGSAGTLIMENVQVQNVTNTVVGPHGVILPGSRTRQGLNDLFIMGHVADDQGLFAQTGYYHVPMYRSFPLLDGEKYYERSKPQYEQVSAQYFLSARVYGAMGDGLHDDTVALNQLFNFSSQYGHIAYLDAGTYLVTDTIFIPPNTKIVGEALGSIIMATGPLFQDMSNPRPVIQVGKPGDTGYIEWSDTIVSTRGPAAGAILIEYNLFTVGTPSGMWDVHTRIGGFAGTNLQLAQCPAVKGVDSVNPNCIAAFMSMHITASAGGLFTENCWLWVADHDLEDQEYSRITIFAGRGLLVESQRGRIWLSASSSEHHVLHQYQFVNTRDIYIGHAQTESPYHQPHPLARYPFPPVPDLYDPDFQEDCQNSSYPESCESAWAMRIINSTNVAVYGAGLYSFFDALNDTCASNKSPEYCQRRTLSISGQREGDGMDLVQSWYNNSTFADTLALYRP